MPLDHDAVSVSVTCHVLFIKKTNIHHKKTELKVVSISALQYIISIPSDRLKLFYVFIILEINQRYLSPDLSTTPVLSIYIKLSSYNNSL